MTDSKHTPEPWEVSDAMCGRHSTSTVAIYHYDAARSHCTEVVEAGCKCGDEAVSKENARRIVACVNACAGIPTYQLLGVTDRPVLLGDVVDVIRKQRDELLEIVEAAYEMVTEADDSKPFDLAVLCEMLHQGILSAQGTSNG